VKFKGVSVSDCTKMGWQGVPCSWAKVAEATLAELSSCSAFKVVFNSIRKMVKINL